VPWWQTRAGTQVFAVVAAGVVVALIVALVGTGGNGGNGSTAAGASTAHDVFLTSASSNGTNPFTASIVATPPSSTVPQATVAPASLAGSGFTTVDGATVGLYGGTRNATSCNPQQMVSYLAQNPDKARAWAAAEGIDPSAIPAYIATLTPVLLRADTRVTNNGYQNGVATPFQTVLEAGTAVLVDRYGIPRARCACGNPLSPPVTYTTPTYTGPAWPAFQPTTVVVVTPAPKPVTVIVIVDVTTGQAFSRPTGTDGTKDTGPPAASSSTTPTAPPTTSTTTAPSGSSTPGPHGSYTLRFFSPSFSGTPGLMSAAACTGASQDLSGPVDIVTSGSAITVTSARFALAGSYNAGDGSFTASASVPPSVGDSKVYAMRGTITSAGAVTGTYSITVAPPTATCEFKMAGAKTA
jgi:hypothetical protein